MGGEYPKGGGGRYSWGIRPSGGDIPRLFVPRGRYPSFERGANLLGGGQKSCDNGMGK